MPDDPLAGSRPHDQPRAGERRQAPPIPDDVSEDIPFGGAPEVKSVPVRDPAGDHRRGMDNKKLTFSILLITGCLVAYVLLTILQYLTQGHFKDATSITSALDVLKLIATTALGFVLARTMDNDNKG